MAFDEKAFMKAAKAAEPRTADVPVPSLAAFFGDGPAQITVRGLTGPELARVHEQVAKNTNFEAIVKAMASGSADPEKVKELMGLSTTKQPDEIVRRLHLLATGAVSPTLAVPVCIQIATVCPVEFYALTNRITELTGLGAELGKPKPSGSAQKSEAA